MLLRSKFDLKKNRKVKETLKSETEWEIVKKIGVHQEQS